MPQQYLDYIVKRPRKIRSRLAGWIRVHGPRAIRVYSIQLSPRKDDEREHHLHAQNLRSYTYFYAKGHFASMGQWRWYREFTFLTAVTDTLR